MTFFQRAQGGIPAALALILASLAGNPGSGMVVLGGAAAAENQALLDASHEKVGIDFEPDGAKPEADSCPVAFPKAESKVP